MSDAPKKDSSTPGALRKRIKDAHESGQPMDLDYDECTGVIDVSLGTVRKATDEGVAQVRALIRRLDSSLPPKAST